MRILFDLMATQPGKESDLSIKSILHRHFQNEVLNCVAFHTPMKIVQTMVSKLQKIFVQTIERIRLGRKYKHNHKVKQKKFHFVYKTVC